MAVALLTNGRAGDGLYVGWIKTAGTWTAVVTGPHAGELWAELKRMSNGVAAPGVAGYAVAVNYHTPTMLNAS